MKAITLWQPWASALVMGVKKYETRSWALPHALIGERVAIHAAARTPKHEYERMVFIAARDGKIMPNVFGAVLGAVTFTRCFRVVGQTTENMITSAHFSNGHSVQVDAWGDYSVGRYIWFAEHPQQYDDPIPLRGGQRIWNWREKDGAPPALRRWR